MLALDAMTNTPPTLWIVLTTRSTVSEPAAFYRSRDQVMKAVRRRWPAAEWACVREFTTGYGPRSGGDRRPHWNVLVKGVPADQLEDLADVVRRVWCAREDALPERQHVGTVYSHGGLMRYLALHFLKESQQPPAGWRGHRFTHSRGYFAQPIAAVREAARTQLRAKREKWKIERDAAAAGVELDAIELHDLAAATIAAQRALTWELVQIHPSGGGDPEPEHLRARRHFRALATARPGRGQ